jgi:hypothetical protein
MIRITEIQKALPGARPFVGRGEKEEFGCRRDVCHPGRDSLLLGAGTMKILSVSSMVRH